METLFIWVFTIWVLVGVYRIVSYILSFSHSYLEDIDNLAKHNQNLINKESK